MGWFSDLFSSDSSGDTGTIDYSQYDWSSPSVLQTAFGDSYTSQDPNATPTSMQMPDGSTAWSNGVVVKPNGDIMLNGEKVANQNTADGSTPDSSFVGTLGTIAKALGTGATGLIKNLVTTNGSIDAGKLSAIAGGILGGLGSNSSWAQPQIQKTGYQGGIPDYTAVRAEVPGTYDPTRRPGSRGQEYFTATQFVSPTDTATAQATAAQQATEAEARNKTRESEYKEANKPVAEYAVGGLANLAQGRYLGGPTDGMADKIPATIAGKQPAKLSHGEFVVPADVVGHLGNGNSEAGAQRLYDMMDRIRTARTGTKKQGKQINPNKFMPG